jgi:predicted PurR-regulated permease PerM
MTGLVPATRREGAREVLELLGITLRRWLIGQSITMAVVGTLTAIGLALFGNALYIEGMLCEPRI